MMIINENISNYTILSNYADFVNHMHESNYNFIYKNIFIFVNKCAIII